jgi:hypothetical protein
VADQKLTYKVDVDTGSAVRDLDKLGDAGEKAGKQIADGFDDAASKSEQAIRALTAQLDKVESEAKSAADAVAAIKGNLTIDVDDSKISAFASNIRSKMGLTFDEITADAKGFADVLERGVNMDATRTEIHGVGDELQHVRSESDQSRSVLANLAGNAAQDLGELGGVVGTLGVGIGQLAEYAVDGNIALSGLAGVAGPMAALAATTYLIGEAVKQIGVEQKETTEQTAKYRDVLAEAGSAALNVRDMVVEAGKLSFADNNADTFLRDLTELLPGVGEGVVNVADIMQRASLNVDDYANAVTGVGDTWNETITQLSLARTQGLISGDEFEAVVAEMEDQRNRIGAAGSDTADFFAQSVDGLNEQFARLQAQDDPFSVMSDRWVTLVDDLRDGKIDTQDAVDAVSDLSLELGKDPGEILDIAWKGLNKTWDAATESADKARQAQVDAAKAARDSAIEVAQAAGVVNQAIRDANQIIGSGAFDATSIDATATAMGGFFDTFTAGREAVAGVQGALDDLQTAFEAQDGLLPNLSTPEGRATLDALEQLGTALIPGIQKAFDQSNGSVGKFKSGMTALYQDTLAQLSDQLNISTDDAAQLLAQIGLTPDNFSTYYELIGDEDAKAKLALLQSTLSSLPAYVQTQVQMQIIKGDYQGAVATIQGYLDHHTTKAQMDLNTQGAEEDYAAFQRRIERNETLATIRVQYVGVNSNSGGGQVGQGGAVRSVGAPAPALALTPAPAGVDEAGDDPTPTAAATVTPSNVWMPTSNQTTLPERTLNVHVAVQAGVIGNRFDVERAVLRAVRSGTRLRGAAALVAP